MAKHRHRERRRRVPRGGARLGLGPIAGKLQDGPASLFASRPLGWPGITPEDIKRAQENAALARRLEDDDSAENRLMRAIYGQLDDYVPDGEEYDPDGVLARLLRSLGDDDDSMSPEEVAARVARFRESLARMDADPAERARIERLAAEAWQEYKQ